MTDREKQDALFARAGFVAGWLSGRYESRTPIEDSEWEMLNQAGDLLLIMAELLAEQGMNDNGS